MTEFGDNFGLFCTPFPNNSEPTGLTPRPHPTGSPIEPVVATGRPPSPRRPLHGGAPTSCTARRRPSGASPSTTSPPPARCPRPNPAAGDQFNVTGYQTQPDHAAPIASAAPALGNTIDQRDGHDTDRRDRCDPGVDASGPLNFSAPLPTPVPPVGRGPRRAVVARHDRPLHGLGRHDRDRRDRPDRADLWWPRDGPSSLRPHLHRLSQRQRADTASPSVPPDAAPISPVIVAHGSDPTPPTAPRRSPPGTGRPVPTSCTARARRWATSSSTTSTTTRRSRAPVGSGQTFEAPNFQTQLTLPSSIASAAAALGQLGHRGSMPWSRSTPWVPTPATVSSGPHRHQRAHPEPGARSRPRPRPALDAGDHRALHRHRWVTSPSPWTRPSRCR